MSPAPGRDARPGSTKVGAGLGSQLGLGPDELTELAKYAAELGYDAVWTPQRVEPDSFTLCRAWAAASARVASPPQVGIGVLPAPSLGDPADLAAAAATTAQHSGGRLVLGIGTGGYGSAFWAGLGLPDRPIAVMRDYLEYLRMALSGRGGAFTGRTFAVPRVPVLAQPPAVPLYLGALGPQMLRLGGEHADGVIMNWADAEGIRVGRRLLDEGAVRGGRPPGSVHLTMYLRCAVGEDVEEARRAIAAEILFKVLPRGQRGGSAMLGYRAQFGRIGFESVIAELDEREQRGASARELADAVPAEMCRAVGYFGDGSDAAARLADLAAGLDHVILQVIPNQRGTDAAASVLDALRPELFTRGAQAGSGS